MRILAGMYNIVQVVTVLYRRRNVTKLDTFTLHERLCHRRPPEILFYSSTRLRIADNPMVVYLGATSPRSIFSRSLANR